ncbi:MAG: arginine repressor [Firmicutes bacterium]|nr:arginine repressor [Bacillota bacterium]
MARNTRQSKILELISLKEIETQEELVAELRAANFDVTQATISRDIKELGLIKILSDSKKYKYAIVGSTNQAVSNKFIGIFKECVISVKNAMNLVVLKTLKGTASMVSNCIDQLSLNNVLGCTYGDDTVMVITADVEDAYMVQEKINEVLLND